MKRNRWNAQLVLPGDLLFRPSSTPEYNFMFVVTSNDDGSAFVLPCGAKPTHYVAAGDISNTVISP